MKEITFEPKTKNDEIIIQFSETFILDKSMRISVPNQYIAIVYDNERIGFRVEPCVDRCIFKEYGKEYLGHTFKIAFIHLKAIPEIIWGFGNIQVNNERLKEAYRVGANGALQIQISDYSKLINYFSQNDDVTIETLKNKIISSIKTVGIPILSNCFANTNTSVFEIDSLLGKIRGELQEGLLGENKFKEMGVSVNSLTINGIHVNEEDLELIRERINNAPKEELSATSEEKQMTDIEKELEKLLDSVRHGKKDEEQDSVTDFQKKQEELIEALKEKITDQLDEFEKSIFSELDEKIQAMLPLQDKARDEYINRIKLTAESILNNATGNDDLIPAAAMIYSNTENNLITKFNLRHEGEKFIISYKEYIEIADKAVIEGRYLLKRKGNNGMFNIVEPRVIEEDKNGVPILVEMVPIVRFIKAGFNVEDAKKATEMWTVLNKIRHVSEENEKILNGKLNKMGVSRKEYLLETLNFYKKLGLYTRD